MFKYIILYIYIYIYIYVRINVVYNINIHGKEISIYCNKVCYERLKYHLINIYLYYKYIYIYIR